MEWEKWIPIIVSVFSLLVAGVSVWYIKSANKLIELQLESQIRTRVDEAYKEILNFKDEELLDVLIENYLNAFDYACKKYLNKELNQKKFQNMYKREIKKLCTDEVYAEQIKKDDFRDIKRAYEKIEK